MMSIFKLKSVALSGIRRFSKTSLRSSMLYNPESLNEKEVLDIEDNLERFLEKKNWKDPELFGKVNIGFAVPNQKRKTQAKTRIEHLKKIQSNTDLKKQSQTNELKIPLEDVAKEWELNSGVQHVHAVAQHYQLFDHLFGLAYFYPVVMMDIGYPLGDKVVPVYRGNIVTPTEASTTPQVQFQSDPAALWTLVCLGMDGNLESSDAQYVHWLVSNIPGNNVTKGVEICKYLQPFPLRGVGYQRFVFLLYKQKSQIQLDPIKGTVPKDRYFNNLEFYRKHQDNLTPAGLAFFQSVWDKSVTRLFHNVFNSTEPVFEYDFDPPHHPPQVWHPKGQPFNLYLDKYRDPKQIAKEYLVKKFKSTNPFEPPPLPVKYPNLVPHDKNKPSWLNAKEKRDRLGWGRINEFLDK